MTKSFLARGSRISAVAAVCGMMLAMVAVPASAVPLPAPASPKPVHLHGPSLRSYPARDRKLISEARRGGVFRASRPGQVVPEPSAPTSVRHVVGSQSARDTQTLTPAGAFIPVPLTRLSFANGVTIPASGSTDPYFSPTLIGSAGIPSDATAVALNVTTLETGSQSGSLKVYPGADSSPSAADFAYPGGNVYGSGMVITPLNSAGQIAIYNSNSAGLAVTVYVDVEGYYIPTGSGGSTRGFVPTAGTQIASTNLSINTPLTGLPVAGGSTGVPAGATSVAVNLEVTSPTASGFLIGYTGSTIPSADDGSVTSGVASDSLLQIAPDANGKINIDFFSTAGSGSLNLTVVVEGYSIGNQVAGTNGGFISLYIPQNITLLHSVNSGVQLVEKVTNQNTAQQYNNVPPEASSVLVDLAASSAITAGVVRAWPTDSPAPSSSQLPVVAGGGTSNTAVVPIGNNGQVSLRPDLTSGSVNLTLTVLGYFTAAPAPPGAAFDPTPYLGNENYWSYSRPVPVGPQSSAKVNVSDGNLVVAATDSTPITGHGHLGFVTSRTYNSLDMASYSSTGLIEGLASGVSSWAAGETATSIGEGWTLNLGDLGASLGAADGAGLSGLLTPDWKADTGQTTTYLPGNQIILNDQDGTRHVFTATNPLNLSSGSGLLVTGGLSHLVTGALGGTLGVFNNTTLSSVLSSLSGSFCVDQQYAAPPGVHLSLWRFVYIGAPGTGTAACTATSGSPITAGYIAERPDGLRFVYASTGQLLDEIDRAGTDLRFVYGGANTVTSLASQITAGVANLPLLGKLRSIYEPGVSTCTISATNPYPAAPCRYTKISYSTDGTGCTPESPAVYAVCITDPAGRLTTYDLDANPDLATLTGTQAHLIRVTNPDGTFVGYQYGCNGGAANQLCSITDPDGGTTQIDYDSGDYPQAAYGPLVSKIVNRRSPAVTQAFSYTLGQLDAQGIVTALPGTSATFAALAGLSSTTEVTTPPGTGFCDASNSPTNCLVSQYTAIDTAGRVGEYDRGVLSASAPCSGQPAGNVDGGGICASQVILTNYDLAHVAQPPAPALTASTTGGSLSGTAPTTYYYEVAAVAGSGVTAVNPATSESQVVMPATTTGSITLAFSAVTGATGYRVYRGLSSGTEALVGDIPISAVSPTTHIVTWTDTGLIATDPAPTVDTTRSLICEQDNQVNDNVCQTLQYGLNDDSTGVSNHIFTPNRQTTFLYGPDGSMVSSDVSMPSGPDIKTSYGYRYQYFTSDGSTPSVAGGTIVNDNPVGSGTVTPSSTLLAPPTAGQTPSYLFMIADKTAMLTPVGNTTSGSFAAYETTYHPDDNPSIAPNTLQSVSGNPAAFTVCSVHSASGGAGAATSDTGVNCETDAPAPTGAGTPSDCQAGAGFACVTYTYDGWGEKTSMTTPLAHTSSAGSSEYSAYRYMYFPDTAKDVSGTTGAGGWLQAVVDPLAGLTDASSAAAVGTVTRHFVAYGYDAAGNTVWTWDRLAIQNGAGAALSSFPGTESGGTPHATEAGFAITQYGSKNSGSADLYAHPWRYVASSSTPLGETTTYGLDANGNDLTVKDPRGNTTTNVYNGDDELTSATKPAGSSDGSVAGTTTYTYTSDGQVAVATSPPLTSGGTGAITETLYNPLDEPAIVITSRAASTPSYVPADCGTNEFGADPGRFGCVTVTTYDGFGNPISTLDPDGALTVSYYDADGRKIGQSVQYNWTTAVPLLQKNFTGAVGQVSNYLTTIGVLDADGNVVQICTPRDFDAADGQIDNTTGGTGTGNNLPTSIASLTTLTSDCAGDVPLYGSQDTYDASDRMTQQVTYRASQGTADGNTVPSGATTLTTTYGYDADGNQTTTLDPAGNATVAPNQGANPVTTTYDLLDRKVSQSVPRISTTHGSPTSETTSWTYDDSGDLTSVTAPPGDSTDSAGGHTARITDSVYDLDHRLIKTVAAATSTNAASITTSDAADQENLITTYDYDADGDLTQQFDPRATAGAPAHPSDYSIGMTYDADDRPIARYTPRYDTSLGTPTGSVQSTQCPTGGAPSGFGFASTTGVCVTTVSYDADGNRTKLVLPTQAGATDLREEDFTYTLDNLVATVSAPSPGSTSGALETVQTDTYNGKGEPVSVADANGQASATTYSSNGLPIFSTDNNATTDATTTIYDANGGTLAVAQQVSNTTPYLASSGITSAFQVTVTKSNSDGTIASSAAGTPELSPPTTRYGYDRDGNTTTITSPNNVTVTDSYTADGLLASTVQPVTSTNSRTTVFSYDPAGRKESQHITSTVGADLGTECFDYYPDDIPSETAARNTATSPCTNQTAVADITDTYDAVGNETDVADSADASTAAGHDVSATYYLDSLLAKTTATGGYGESLTYNGSGSVATRSTTVGSATQTISFTDNDAGLPATATSNQIASSKSWAFTYDAIGQLSKETMPTADTLTNTYSSTNETLTSTALTTSAAHNVATFGYGYDLVKRITSQSRSGDTTSLGTSGPVDSTYSYQYDEAGRLCQFADASQTRDMTYDQDGNRKTYGNTADVSCLSKTAPSASATQTLAYNLDDSIQSGPPGGVAACTTSSSYTYNSVGELASDGLNNYTYDGFGNTSADNESNLTLSCILGLGISLSNSTYTYDGLGRQVTNKAATLAGLSSNGTDTMNYDGLTSQLLAESVPAQTPSSRVSVPVADYIRNQDGTVLAVGNDVASGASTGTGSGAVEQYLADDGNGDVGTVTNTSGVFACAERYDPYGSTETGSGCDAMNASLGYEGSLTYQTNRLDATGDYQDGSRTYEPNLDAFTSPDGYGPGTGAADESVGTDPITADTYTYVNGDPVNFSDPNGHMIACDPGENCGAVQKEIISYQTSYNRAASAYYASHPGALAALQLSEAVDAKLAAAQLQQAAAAGKCGGFFGSAWCHLKGFAPLIGQGILALGSDALAAVTEEIPGVDVLTDTLAGEEDAGAVEATESALGAASDAGSLSAEVTDLTTAADNADQVASDAEAVADRSATRTIEREASKAAEESPATEPAAETAAGVGARDAAVEATTEGQRFVRIGAGPQNLKWTFEHPGGTAPGTYAVPEEYFNSISHDPAFLKDIFDLPDTSLPQYYRILEPPAGTPIQYGTVPGGEFGGSGGAPEVFFPKGF